MMRARTLSELATLMSTPCRCPCQVSFRRLSHLGSLVRGGGGGGRRDGGQQPREVGALDGLLLQQRVGERRERAGVDLKQQSGARLLVFHDATDLVVDELEGGLGHLSG